MKRTTILMLFALLVLALSAQIRGENIVVSVEPDHQDWTYVTGQKATFTVSVRKSGTLLSNATIDYAAGRNRYIGYLISLATHSYKHMRVGLDCANGSTWQIAKSVFDALGADTYVVATSPTA